MNAANRNAIARLSAALDALNQNSITELRVLTQGLLDDKHQRYLELGLAKNDRAQLLHAIVGMLSHYEAEHEKELTHPDASRHP
ncbi:hypothetical protein C4580_01445 [Candidatus Woesearchaeota archaeon]|nr:MAG: hypothetical protein C4580_01445 [Candidatus Woesearchaeota archaeon]